MYKNFLLFIRNIILRKKGKCRRNSFAKFKWLCVCKLLNKLIYIIYITNWNKKKEEKKEKIYDNNKQLYVGHSSSVVSTGCSISTMISSSSFAEAFLIFIRLCSFLIGSIFFIWLFGLSVLPHLWQYLDTNQIRTLLFIC